MNWYGTVGPDTTQMSALIHAYAAQWARPFDAPSSANWVALIASRYFFEFGTTREQLAQIALTCRRSAASTEDAISAAIPYSRRLPCSTPLTSKTSGS